MQRSLSVQNHRSGRVIGGVLIALLSSCTSTVLVKYPFARRGDVVDIYHGTKLGDPYRWLEDLDSEETRAWIEAENRHTFDYLEQIPDREKIGNRLTRLWNYEKYGIPFKEGGRYFFTKNDGLQDHGVFYNMDSIDGEPQRAAL